MRFFSLALMLLAECRCSRIEVGKMLLAALGALALLVVSMIVMFYWKCWRLEASLAVEKDTHSLDIQKETARE
jgi:hypothetical protein